MAATGRPACLPAMSHRALSTALSAIGNSPRRPYSSAELYIWSQSCSTLRGSVPISRCRRCPRMISTAGAAARPHAEADDPLVGLDYGDDGRGKLLERAAPAPAPRVVVRVEDRRIEQPVERGRLDRVGSTARTVMRDPCADAPDETAAARRAATPAPPAGAPAPSPAASAAKPPIPRPRPRRNRRREDRPGPLPADRACRESIPFTRRTVRFRARLQAVRGPGNNHGTKVIGR